MAVLPAAPVTSDVQSLDRSWGVVAASTIGLTFSLGTLLVYTFGVFVRPLTAEFGWTRTQLSGAVAISQYALAISSPLWGYLIDRFGSRSIVVPSAVCLSVMVASLAFLTPHLWHFYLVFGGISFVAGGATPLGYSTVLVRKFNRRLGLALGLCFMGVGVGATILPPLAQALMNEFGWRGAYAGLGLLTLILTLPAALYATRGLPRPTNAMRASAVTVPVLPFIWTRTFLLLSIIFILFGAVSVGTLVNLVPIMTSRGFSPQGAAQLAAVTGLVAIAGRSGIGFLLDRFHAPYVVAGVATIGLGALLLLAYGQGTVAAYLIAILLGAVVGAEVDFTAFFVRRYFGDVVFGRLYGLAFGIFIVGSGTGPVVAGALFDSFGNYQAGALVFAAACLIIVLLALLLPPYDTPHAPRGAVMPDLSAGPSRVG